MSSPQDRPVRDGTVAPAVPVTLTPADPSAFMTTSAQSPLAGRQVSCWVPDPLACAVQKVWSPGAPDGAPPSCRVPPDAPLPRSSTTVRRTPSRYPATSDAGAIPMKTSEPGSVPVTSNRAVPRVEETGTQSAPVDRSSRSLVSANPE